MRCPWPAPTKKPRHARGAAGHLVGLEARLSCAGGAPGCSPFPISLHTVYRGARCRPRGLLPGVGTDASPSVQKGGGNLCMFGCGQLISPADSPCNLQFVVICGGRRCPATRLVYLSQERRLSWCPRGVRQCLVPGGRPTRGQHHRVCWLPFKISPFILMADNTCTTVVCDGNIWLYALVFAIIRV